jgi:hypothetical protein
VSDDFKIGYFGEEKEGLQMFDVVLWFFNQFMVDVFDGFNLLFYIHGE